MLPKARRFDDEEAWREAWTCKFSSKSHTLASWLIQLLNGGVLGHWIEPKEGTFELNWAEAAQNWYKAKKRHSRAEDASHLLHKGIQAAFPKLDELKRERTGHQCVRRSFKISEDIIRTVQAIVVGTSNTPRKRCKCESHEAYWPLSEHLLGFDSPIRVSPTKEGPYPPYPRSPGPSNEDMIRWVMKSGHGQLMKIYQWAARIEEFRTMSDDDQKMLLKNAVNDLLTINLAYRSVDLKDQLKLATGKVIEVQLIREHFTKSLAMSVVRTIVSTLKELNLTRSEFELVQKIILFNPHTDGLLDVLKTKASRRQLHNTLSSCTSPDRFAEILLLLPAVQSIGLSFKEQLHEHTMLGIPEYIESFMNLAYPHIITRADDVTNTWHTRT